MDKIEISVLMPVCNKEHKEYLKEALDSIINQTYKPKEIVIIQDGKLDESKAKLLKSYKQKYSNLINIFEIKKTKSLGVVLNYGVQKCKYEYIARMDADDISELDRFERQAKVLIKNPEIDILGGYINCYDEKMKKIVSTRKVPLTDKKIKKKVKKISPFNHGTVIIKKKKLIEIGNYKDLPIEDYELWGRFAINDTNLRNLDMALVKSRTSKDMYKRRSGFKYIKKVKVVQKLLMEYKIINRFEYYINISVRTIFALLPINLKQFLHKISKI